MRENRASNEDKIPEILLQRTATAKDVAKRIHDGY